jgi:hypothetical protein
MRGLRMIVTSAAVAWLAACASRPVGTGAEVSASAEATASIQQVDLGTHETPEPPNWTDPVAGGLTIESSSEANLGFKPVDPPALIGEVQLIQTTDPDKVPSELGGVVWVLNDGTTVFDLTEKAPTMSQTDLEALAKCQAAESACSTMGWSLVDIGTGSLALLIDAESTELPASATSIMWLDGDVQFEILGRVGGLTADSAVAKATAIASSS